MRKNVLERTEGGMTTIDDAEWVKMQLETRDECIAELRKCIEEMLIATGAESPEAFLTMQIRWVSLHPNLALEPGTQIIYVPDHASGDWLHDDCERGFVTHDPAYESVRDSAFCRYWSKHSPGELRTKANSELTPKRCLALLDTVEQKVVDRVLVKIEEKKKMMNKEEFNLVWRKPYSAKDNLLKVAEQFCADNLFATNQSGIAEITAWTESEGGASFVAIYRTGEKLQKAKCEVRRSGKWSNVWQKQESKAVRK